MTRTPRRLAIDLALLLLVVAIFAIPLALRLNTDGQAEGESYAGSDSSAATKVEEINPDYDVWFTPFFEPSSGEIESGLFALQAAAGAGALGFVLGRLSGKRQRPRES
ncbi:energy-coupling factor ABC transporter substrate-binding protein [Kineosporia succinea]|uniref:Cobalt transport protein CbiN n=1 Tax=Kineosporia succinea TaxID=84632 RepID=A0ABT9P7Z3_9ACTN|nr:energy-coupling factor ABC transporter substrate-binding protein [Kineosporia succinea]MDP9828821.1 cobalt/nickel transport protein [Kineosporia succinea]